MFDCNDIEVRELLPDYLNSHISDAERTRVDAHLATCPSCRAELDALRTARAVLQSVRLPAVNTASIVAALPRAEQRRRRTTSPLVWRVAAVLTVAAIGGTAWRAALGRREMAARPDSVVAAPGQATVATSPRESSRVSPTAQPQLVLGAGEGELADDDLETLISALETLDVGPVAEPDSGGFRLTTPSISGGV